jgi:hypothetical protein
VVKLFIHSVTSERSKAALLASEDGNRILWDNSAFQTIKDNFEGVIMMNSD